MTSWYPIELYEPFPVETYCAMSPAATCACLLAWPEVVQPIILKQETALRSPPFVMSKSPVSVPCLLRYQDRRFSVDIHWTLGSECAFVFTSAYRYVLPASVLYVRRAARNFQRFFEVPAGTAPHRRAPIAPLGVTNSIFPSGAQALVIARFPTVVPLIPGPPTHWAPLPSSNVIALGVAVPWSRAKAARLRLCTSLWPISLLLDVTIVCCAESQYDCALSHSSVVFQSTFAR